MEWPFDMSPKAAPSKGMHLEVNISKLLGRGCSGHVYDVDIIGVSPRAGLPTSPLATPLPPLCIKLAEPNRLRWFYTSKCALSQIIPWRARDWQYHSEIKLTREFLVRLGYAGEDASRDVSSDSPIREQLDEAEVDRHDWLKLEPEELHHGDFADDAQGSNNKSPWKHWNWKMYDPAAGRRHHGHGETGEANLRNLRGWHVGRGPAVSHYTFLVNAPTIAYD